MTLRQKQARFAQLAARLIQQADALGYEVTLGDAYRDARAFGDIGQRKAYGHPKSCHKLRLAIDLNLFVDGVYRGDTASHRPLGEWWEQQGGTWGGRFGDANHYSLEHDGMR